MSDKSAEESSLSYWLQTCGRLSRRLERMQAGRAACVWMFHIRLPGCGHASCEFLHLSLYVVPFLNISRDSRPVCWL